MGYPERAEQLAERIQKEIQEMLRQLETLPEGALKIYRNGSYLQVNRERTMGTEKVRQRLSKDDRQLIMQLIERERIQEKLKEALRVQSAVNGYRSLEQSVREKTTRQRQRREAIAGEYLHMEPPQKLAKAWMEESYPTNPLHLEEKNVLLPNGQKVRSKSEYLIATTLSAYEIPFRYECRLDLGSNIYYPDFMILHPQTGKLYLWEHFGMMDEYSYRKNAWKKLDKYISFGYLPDDNLILTFEDKQRPLDIITVKKVIENLLIWE